MPVLRNNAVKMLTLGILCVAVSGCVATPFNGRPMTDRIALDAADFSRAYADAANAQLLSNILYSRDRLPKHYTSIKEITTEQSRAVELSSGLSDIKLGNPATNTGGEKLWSVGMLGAKGSAETAPSYGVTPLIADELTKGVLTPISAETFIKYWDAQWPKDVLMAVLVSKAVKLHCTEGMINNLAAGCGDESAILNNTGNETFHNNAEELKEKDTSFMAFARWLHEPILLSPPAPGSIPDLTLSYAPLISGKKETTLEVAPAVGSTLSTTELSQLTTGLKAAKDADFDISLDRAVTGVLNVELKGNVKKHVLLKVENAGTAEKATCIIIEDKSTIENSNSNHQVCKDTGPPTLNGTWVLELRSLDEAVYFLGELIRKQEEDDPLTYGRANIVNAADCDPAKQEKKTYPAPLFQVRREDSPVWILGRAYPERKGGEETDEPLWAARTKYRGGWYFSGPASPLKAECKGKGVVDRSGTVLTLLGQILEINRSTDSVRLPARIGN